MKAGFKKLAALGLVGAMAATTVLTGCGGSAQPTQKEGVVYLDPNAPAAAKTQSTAAPASQAEAAPDQPGTEPPAAEDMPFKGDTVIGNDVWIGQNARILPGVSIGDGAIIGAFSVVGHDVEPYSIVAGNPAKLIRKRFEDELTGLLLAWKWWDKPIAEIDRLIPILTSGDLEKVKEEIKKELEKCTR